MYKFMSTVFKVLGAILFVYAFIFLWAYFVGYAKAGMVLFFLARFSLRLFMGGALFLLGNLMQIIMDAEQRVERYLMKPFRK